MSDLLALPHQLDRETCECRAIVETPRGCRSKYDYDPDSGLFELAGVLPAGMAFPLAFGFVPSTRGEDGDPLDILVIADEDLPIGCLLTARLLGVIEAKQTQGNKTVRNDRLIARVSQSRAYADVTSLDQLGSAFADELTTFFETYNALKGYRFGFGVIAVADARRACNLIETATR
jgi:inorganic pyrophosphatase